MQSNINAMKHINAIKCQQRKNCFNHHCCHSPCQHHQHHQKCHIQNFQNKLNLAISKEEIWNCVVVSHLFINKARKYLSWKFDKLLFCHLSVWTLLHELLMLGSHLLKRCTPIIQCWVYNLGSFLSFITLQKMKPIVFFPSSKQSESEKEEIMKSIQNQFLCTFGLLFSIWSFPGQDINCECFCLLYSHSDILHIQRNFYTQRIGENLFASHVATCWLR